MRLAQLGIPKRTHQGLRITDAETLDEVISVLAGLVNKSLVAEFCARGVVAAGFSGVDGATLRAEFHPRMDEVDLGFVGRVVAANPTLLKSVLKAGMLPVVASIAMGPQGFLLNLNADAAASALAVSLRARRLVFLTDVEGLLDESGRVVGKLTASEACQLLDSNVVNGGMRPKLAACLEAISDGVTEVVIAGPNTYADTLARGRGGTHLAPA